MGNRINKSFLKLFQNKEYTDRMLYLLDGNNNDHYLEDIVYNNLNRKVIFRYLINKILKRKNQKTGNIDTALVNEILGLDNLFCVLSPFYDDGKDGFFRRIRQIDDSLLEEYTKVYLSCSNLLNRDFIVKKVDDKHYVVYFNSFDRNHLEHIEKIIKHVKKVYIHSIHVLMPDYINSELCDYIFNDEVKSHIDIHGVVAEEMKMSGDLIRSELAAYVESNIINACDRIICVTESMKNHYKKKYNIEEDRFLVVPIFSSSTIDTDAVLSNKKEKDKDIIIYSGGLNKWQNIEMMNEIIEKTVDDYDYRMYVFDPDLYKKTVNNDIIDKMIIDNISHDEIEKELLKSDFGFVLRENNIVNMVACPTKLIEYIKYGVIPILLNDKLGDFKKNGLQYIRYEDLLDRKLPSHKQRLKIIVHNIDVLKKMEKKYSYGKVD